MIRPRPGEPGTEKVSGLPPGYRTRPPLYKNALDTESLAAQAVPQTLCMTVQPQ
jgi:hypothetical protein